MADTEINLHYITLSMFFVDLYFNKYISMFLIKNILMIVFAYNILNKNKYKKEKS